MLVSILMSVYNGDATLQTAIDSVLAQTLSDFEFIICDDGSTDHSWNILCEYQRKDDRIYVFRNLYNIGLAASLNKCLALAKGKFIARQDADDVSVPERLEKTLFYLQKEDAPYVGCGVHVFDDSGVWSHRMFPEQITKRIIAQKNPFFHPTMVFKREILELVDGYRVSHETVRTEDYDLVMRLAGHDVIGKNLQEYLYYVYEPLEAYRRHTLKTRWYEILVRLYGFRQMAVPLWDYIYLFKPVVMCVIPHGLLKQVKCLQWKERREGDAHDSTERNRLHT